MGNDIPGERKMLVGLTQIKGIGYNFATAILDTLKIDSNSNIGHLTDENVQAIEKLITNPVEGNFPTWFLNRRKDIETGNDLHLLTSDIPFTLRNDIERERVTASWRGYRHLSGLKVRGQRTELLVEKAERWRAKGGMLPAKAALQHHGAAAAAGDAGPARREEEEIAEKKNRWFEWETKIST